MNKWGWWGCWVRRPEIVAWFVEKGREAGVPIRSESVAGLLRAAFREYWRNRKTATAP
jgi:hypothetical protein